MLRLILVLVVYAVCKYDEDSKADGKMEGISRLKSDEELCEITDSVQMAMDYGMTMKSC